MRTGKGEDIVSREGTQRREFDHITYSSLFRALYLRLKNDAISNLNNEQIMFTMQPGTDLDQIRFIFSI